MIILALDTASVNCAVALVAQNRVLSRISENIGKGHAEKLIDQIDLVCQNAGFELANIDKVAVNIGPGSFTGVRIGVSTARALSLALVKPAIGICSLEALAYEAARSNQTRPISAVIHAGRDMLYRQDFSKNGEPLCDPFVQTFEQTAKDLIKPVYLAGSAAIQLKQIARLADCDIYEREDADVTTYALLAAENNTQSAPRPLYLREADAKPQSGFALPRKL